MQHVLDGSSSPPRGSAVDARLVDDGKEEKDGGEDGWFGRG